MKNSQKKAVSKTIYFTDISDIELLNDYVKDGFIFDRKKIIPQKNGMDKNVFNYFSNHHLEQEFLNVIKNKKVVNIIYRLHYNTPDKILVNIKNVIKKSKNNKNVGVLYKYIVLKSCFEPDEITHNLYDEVIVIDRENVINANSK